MKKEEKAIKRKKKVQKLKNNCETDYSNYQIPTSNNQTFGMGYKKLSGLLNHGTGEKKSESISENNVFGKKSLKFGGGFGVGVFEEEDDGVDMDREEVGRSRAAPALTLRPHCPPTSRWCATASCVLPEHNYPE